MLEYVITFLLHQTTHKKAKHMMMFKFFPASKASSQTCTPSKRYVLSVPSETTKDKLFPLFELKDFSLSYLNSFCSFESIHVLIFVIFMPFLFIVECSCYSSRFPFPLVRSSFESLNQKEKTRITFFVVQRNDFVTFFSLVRF